MQKIWFHFEIRKPIIKRDLVIKRQLVYLCEKRKAQDREQICYLYFDKAYSNSSDKWLYKKQIISPRSISCSHFSSTIFCTDILRLVTRWGGKTFDGIVLNFCHR